MLWSEDSLDYTGEFHRINLASINPRPSQPIPIWFGGAAPALIDRAARLGDGWMPLGGPGNASAEILSQLQHKRAAAGLPWAGFGVQAQAMFAGGDPERWSKHANKWRELGATHLAVRTDSAGLGDVDDHLRAMQDYQQAVSS